jgi:hypothetical protein
LPDKSTPSAVSARGEAKSRLIPENTGTPRATVRKC